MTPEPDLSRKVVNYTTGDGLPFTPNAAVYSGSVTPECRIHPESALSINNTEERGQRVICIPLNKNEAHLIADRHG